MSLWSRVQRRLGDLAGELVLDEYRDQLDQAQRLVAAGDAGSATELLEALLEAKPEDGEDLDARAALGEALVSDGGPYDEALRHLERAGAADAPPALALAGLGRMALVDGAVAVAEERLGRARAIAERDPTPLGAQVR